MDVLWFWLSFVNGLGMGWFGRQWLLNHRELRRLESERALLKQWDTEDRVSIKDLEARRREWLAAVKTEHEIYDHALGERKTH